MEDYNQMVKKMKEVSLELVLASRDTLQILSQFRTPPTTYKERILKASKDLNLVFLTDEQRTLYHEIAREMASMVPFSDYIIRGFLWRAIKKWQRKHNKPIAIVSQTNRTEQFRTGMDILNIAMEFMNRAIYMPDKKSKRHFLAEIIRRISDYYDELLSVQAFLNDSDNEEILLEYEISTWLEENESLFLLSE